MKYKELQIIKHALQFYTNRLGATNKEIEEERRLLGKITNQVNDMIERYNIKQKDKRPPDH